MAEPQARRQASLAVLPRYLQWAGAAGSKQAGSQGYCGGLLGAGFGKAAYGYHSVGYDESGVEPEDGAEAYGSGKRKSYGYCG
jgi:hypothetical protein